MPSRTQGPQPWMSLALLVALPWATLCHADPGVTVDPPDRLSGAAAITGWVVTDAGLTWTDPSNGPDLDLGYSDFLQLRAQLPAGYVGDLAFSFGTSTRPGFAADRRFAIHAASLVRDGAFHTYRLDLGLEVLWRDRLTDLRLEPAPGPDGKPQAVTVDYLEIGDAPGDTYDINRDLNIFVGDDQHPAEQASDLQRMESKHFVFWWSPMSTVSFDSFDPAVMGRRALRMCEECFQVYCKVGGFTAPFENSEPARRDGKRYKINITSWYQGTWMGGQNGWGYLNIPGWGLGDEGWGSPVPHEFGHVLQSSQPGFLTGAHWESHANYLRELRNRHVRALLPGYITQLERGQLERSCFVQDQFRLIYADFRIYAMLDDFGAEMGLGPGLTTRLWTDGPKEMTAYAKLASLLPPGRSVKDVACFGLRHWPLLDMVDAEGYRAQLWKTPRDRAAYEQATGSYLEPRQDRPGWWRVPWSRAPLRYAFMWHELTPDSPGGTVTVDLQGIDTPGEGEDWRWSLVAVKGDDTARYSDLWGPGRHALQLQPDETRLLLFVVATPEMKDVSPHGLQDESPFDKCERFQRYPYEVRIQGAHPAPQASDWQRPAGRAHPNGGGWVADTAQVEAAAYVSPGARVLDRARVLGNARVADHAVVCDDATVQEDAVVGGWAWVGGASVVRGGARVRDHARAEGGTVLEGDARVQGYAAVSSVKAGNQAIIRGNATPWDCTIGGHAIADWDYSMPFELSDGVHFNHVPWGGWFEPYWAQTLRKPRGLLASYRFDEPDGQECWDEFGTLHGLLRGRPRRVLDAAHHSEVLALDGRDQYAVVDRSVCDTHELSLGLWCKPDGTDADRPVVCLSGDPDHSLRVVPRDAAGLPACVLRGGPDGQVTLTAPAPPAPGEWLQLTVTMDGQTARLFVNGERVAEHACTLVGESFLGPDDYSRPQGNYIGRDWEGRCFSGRVDDVRFYNVALTPQEVGLEVQRSGDLLALCLPQETAFDGQRTDETGVRNGRERTLCAWISTEATEDVAEYQAVLDSRDERNGDRAGSGFGLDSGKLKVRLDGVGYWEPEVAVEPARWQHVALAFDGARARLYLDGREVASRDYTVADDRISPKNYRIGYTQVGEDRTTRTCFRGKLRDVRVYDRALGHPEVAALASRQ